MNYERIMKKCGHSNRKFCLSGVTTASLNSSPSFSRREILSMEPNLIRRSLLGAGLLGAETFLGKLLPTAAFAQTSTQPAHTSYGNHNQLKTTPTIVYGGNMTIGAVNHVRNGFNPHTMLTDWAQVRFQSCLMVVPCGNMKLR